MNATLLFTVAAAAACPSATFAQWTVVDLHPPGAQESFVSTLAGGQQGGYAAFNTITRAGSWRGSSNGWQDLSSLVAESSYVFAANGGTLVGTSGYGGSFRAILWTDAQTAIDLSPEGAYEAGAYGISADTVVGYSWFIDQAPHACMWDRATGVWTDLQGAGGSQSAAYAVSGSQQVGGSYVDGWEHACLWNGTPDSWIDLHPPGALKSVAESTDGSRQGGSALYEGGFHAGIWSGSRASWVDLHPSGAEGSWIGELKGSTQVGTAVFNSRGTASLWRGSAASWTNLGAQIPPSWNATGSSASCTSEDAYFTYVGGAALVHQAYPSYHAALWIKPRGDLACAPADLGGPGGSIGGDGTLDNNDFIVYISAFFDRSPGADRGVAGGVPGADGEFDNNDFIVFIDQFFAGC